MDNTIKMPKDCYAFIDGSFNASTNVYGCGGYLIDQFGKKHIIKASGNDPKAAKLRNVAGELMGARKVLGLARKLRMDHIMIFHDYAGIANWPLGKWKAKNKYTREYIAYVWKIATEGLMDITFVKVSAHTGIVGNDEADKLAKEAVGLIPKVLKAMSA